MTATEDRELVAWSAERNPEISRLVAWMEDHRGADARLTRHPNHRGYLSVHHVLMAGGRSQTTVRVRDSRRRGGAQYRAVWSLADVEIKVGARYQPATEVIG